MVQIIATIEGTRLTIKTAKNEQVFKIFETVHTKKSFDFYPTRVTFLKTNLGVGLPTTSKELHTVCFMMQMIVADRFFNFFQKAEEFYIKGAWAKDTEWIGPIYGG